MTRARTAVAGGVLALEAVTALLAVLLHHGLTAEYGDVTRGPRIVTAKTKQEMRKILKEIQSGKFAKEWVAENEGGLAKFNQLRAEGAKHPIEEVGKELRAMMPFLGAGKQKVSDVSGG